MVCNCIAGANARIGLALKYCGICKSPRLVVGTLAWSTDPAEKSSNGYKSAAFFNVLYLNIHLIF